MSPAFGKMHALMHAVSYPQTSHSAQLRPHRPSSEKSGIANGEVMHENSSRNEGLYADELKVLIQVIQPCIFSRGSIMIKMNKVAEDSVRAHCTRLALVPLGLVTATATVDESVPHPVLRSGHRVSV